MAHHNAQAPNQPAGAAPSAAYPIDETTRWRAAIECAGDGVWDWDIPTSQVFFSELWKAMLGYGPDDIGSSLDEWSTRVHPDDIAAAYADINRHLRGETPIYQNEHRMRCKDGSYKWILDRGKAVAWDADGTPVRMIGTHKDISGRNAERTRLRDLTNRLNAVIEGSSRVSIITTDTKGVITLFNSGAENLLGYSAAEMVGQCTPERFHVAAEIERRSAELSRELGIPISGFEAFVAAARRKGFEAREWTYVRKDGTHRIVWLTVNALTDTDGAAIGYMGVAVDLTDHKMAEARLKESETLFRSYAEADLIGMAISSPDKGWIQFNGQFCATLGYTADEMRELSWPDFTHPDDLGADLAYYEQVLDGTIDHYRLQKRYIRKDGATVWADISVRGIRRDDGSIERFVAMVQDITESKRTEEQLRDARKRLEALLSASLVTIYALPPNDLWTNHYISENIESLTGVPHAEAMGGNHWFLDRVHAEDKDYVLHATKTWVASGAPDPISMQYRFRRADDTWIWLNDRIAAVRTESGDVAEYVGALTDVTAEIESTRRLARVSQHIHGMIYQYRLRPDGSSHFPYASEGIRAIYGLAPAAVRDDASAVFARLHPEDADRIAASIRQSADSLEPWTCEYRVNLPEGTIWVEGDATPQREPDGSTLWHGYIWDITARKKAEEERSQLEARLLHAQKLESLGVLAGGIAHDFNNLLLAVYGNLDLAMRDTVQTAVRHSIEEALAAARKAGALTNQMLAYSGRGKFVAAATDINRLINDHVEILRAVVPKAIALRLELSDNLPPVVADAAQIQQVIINLATNAAEAISTGDGTVTLATGAASFTAAQLAATRGLQKPPPGEYVFIRISDTGCGMDEVALRRLFEPFFSTKFTGRGLGMSAVLGIVDKHKGAIFVESAPGQGAVATVLLPPAAVADAAAKPVAIAPAPSAGDGQASILVVDDEDMVRAASTRLLERLGHRVFAARDGFEAVETYREHRGEIDCVLLDLTMPRMDGAAALDALRQFDPEVRVILCSGYSEHEIERRFAGKGVAAVLHKPFLLDDLRGALAAALNP